MLREELLGGGWANADFASKPLKAAGFSKKQIWAASKKLNVVRKKGGMKGGWYWRLPGADPGPIEDSVEGAEGSEDSEDSEGSNSSNTESWGATDEDSQGSVSGILESSKPSESSESSEELL